MIHRKIRSSLRRIGSRRPKVQRFVTRARNLSPRKTRLSEYGSMLSAARQYRLVQRMGRQIIKRWEGIDTAVVVHLYYTESWDLFSKKLKVLSNRKFDLFVTMPRHNLGFADVIRQDFPDAYIFEVPNWGRDVLPFMQIASLIYEKGYSYVLKIHSKKSTHRTDGNTWLRQIVDSLLPDNPEAIDDLYHVLGSTMF
jgi:lipopolysaccharide biosynthesis protein